MALTMVSPSRVSTRRNTPCVEGCCGPMLMVMVSRRVRSLSCTLSSTSSACCSSVCMPSLYLLTAARRSLACLRVPLAPAAFRPLRPFRLAWIACGRRLLGALRRAQRLPADALGQWRAKRHLATPVRLWQLDTRQRVVLAQRMAHPVLRHDDAGEVRMPGEANAAQVEDFALEEGGGRPHRGQRRHLR